ncbi:hydroxyacid dehydrogenase [Brachybacterium hainanense]|uniref:Hydroxyacid dehydrogenase n=1 Tax=Brachybacterium hainanense TaxID=1541174 RepID=A0ABV6R6T3_9MICO
MSEPTASSPPDPASEQEARRPSALLAMSAQLPPLLMTPAQRSRLEELVDLLVPEPVPDWGAARAEDLARTEVLVTGWGAPLIDEDALARMPRLRAVIHTAGTVQHLIGPAVWDRGGIVVTTAAQANAVPVAEFSLAQILLAGKRTLARTAEHRRGRGTTAAWRSDAPGGNYGSVVGLIGASRIGRLVAQMLAPFDVHVLISDPFLSVADADGLGAEKVELPELFSRSDVVSLHAPDVPSTRGMITGELLALMADGTTFINTARPALVDEDALRAELLTGRISAVLDVHDRLAPDDPLWEVPTVEITPHIAGSLGNELHRMAQTALEDLELLLAGRPPRYPVDPSLVAITA